MAPRRRSETQRALSNETVAALLQEYSDLLAITGADAFKPRVYEKAARAVRFFQDPASRIYVSTYTDGRRLCEAYAAQAPGNFSRLLTEQLTTADILDAV